MDSQQLGTPHSTTTLPQTLEQLLSNTDSELFQDYQHFLEQSFCCENLYFWLDVQEYNDLCGQVSNDGFQFRQNQATTQLDPASQVVFNVVQQKCHAMIDTYIQPNANQEINIPCELREELLHQVFTCGNYHPTIFTKIAKSVVELMRVNAFIPWISSSLTASPSLSSSCLIPSQPPTTSSSPTALSFSFVVDRWTSFHKPKGLSRSGSMDSASSMDRMEEDRHLTMSPPPSPTISSPPARYRSMLQRVRHSFMPPSSTTILRPSISLKKEHQHH